MLDLKLTACPGFIEGQDPDVEALGPAFYKSFALKKQVPLVLGVGAAFLALATPGDIRQRVKNYVEIGGKGGGFAGPGLGQPHDVVSFQDCRDLCEVAPFH